MKKIWLIILLVLIPFKVHASYTSVLHNELKNNSGLFFAYTANFESGERLITAAADESSLRIRALDQEDGEEVTDELNIITGGGNVYSLSIVKSSDYDYILLTTNNTEELYTLKNDSFVRTELLPYETITRVARISDDTTDTFGNTKGGVYNLLNEQKKKQIGSYSFINRINSMTDSELNALRSSVAAFADIMSYDSKNIDVDKLMVKILNTHENFRAVTDIDPGNYSGSSGGVGLVKVEYIDHIAGELFGIEPPHPPINELMSRGYCVNNGYYNYTKAYDVEFSTDVKDIEAVYAAGADVYFVIFGDIYTENGESIPEYSYMILRVNDGRYKAERIDMGGEFPDEHEILEYAGEKRRFFWERRDGFKEDDTSGNSVVGWTLLIGVIVLIIAAIVIAVRKEKK